MVILAMDRGGLIVSWITPTITWDVNLTVQFCSNLLVLQVDVVIFLRVLPLWDGDMDLNNVPRVRGVPRANPTTNSLNLPYINCINSLYNDLSHCNSFNRSESIALNHVLHIFKVYRNIEK